MYDEKIYLVVEDQGDYDNPISAHRDKSVAEGIVLRRRGNYKVFDIPLDPDVRLLGFDVAFMPGREDKLSVCDVNEYVETTKVYYKHELVHVDDLMDVLHVTLAAPSADQALMLAIKERECWLEKNKEA